MPSRDFVGGGIGLLVLVMGIGMDTLQLDSPFSWITPFNWITFDTPQLDHILVFISCYYSVVDSMFLWVSLPNFLFFASISFLLVPNSALLSFILLPL
jgi:hypothetical protein